MKKSLLLGLMLCLCVFIGVSHASTYDIDIMNLPNVSGFGFDIDTSASITTSDYAITNGDAVPPISGSTFWNIWKTSSPVFGVQGTDFINPGEPLGNGTIVTITGDFEFDLVNFRLGARTSDGKYPDDFVVNFDGGTSTYTYTNVVPIPGAIWLLGSGLVGMVGIRRKLDKS